MNLLRQREMGPFLEIDPIEPPEDWTGPLNRIEPEDLDSSDSEMDETDWAEPLQEIHQRPDPESSLEEGTGEEGDDEWGKGHMEEELRPID